MESANLESSNRLVFGALACALVLGIFGDQLILCAEGLGLGAALWVAALSGGTLALARWGLGAGALKGEGRWLVAMAVLFAACFVWRGSDVLQLLDIMAIGLSLGLAALTLRGGSLSRAGVLSYPLGLVVSGVHHAIGPLLMLFSDSDWKALPREEGASRRRAAAAALRGLLIAVPLLLIFGALFAAADAVFARLVGDLFTFDLEDLLGHIFGTLFFGWLAAGFLRTGLIKKPEELPHVGEGRLLLGPIEVGVVLGLLNLLFLAFVAVQVRYLFGGAALVEATAHLTYAEYARQGFFELVLVTALVLPVLLGLHWALGEDELALRLYRWLGSSLVALLFVIMASALQRMGLYAQQYGLTEARLYATAFMLWIGVLFIWFFVTVLRGRRERFAVGALVTGFVVLFALHAINPEALIARTNLALRAETGRFDALYAASLGPDALPVLVPALDELPAEVEAPLREALVERFSHRRPLTWRSWNWGEAQGRKAAASLLAQWED